MMLANGLVQNIDECIRRPVFLLNSGPAAAPSGAVYLGSISARTNLLSIDMGGTSFDVCMINKGEIPTTTENWVSDQRVAIKMVDIADRRGRRLDGEDRCARPVARRTAKRRRRSGSGLLRHAASDATVTDADLILGYVPADYFLGGEIKLDAKASRRAMKQWRSRSA